MSPPQGSHAPLTCVIEGATCTSAETFVFVHGFPDSPAVFQESATRLAARGHRVIRVALPGFERANAGTLPISFDALIERLYATLSHHDALGATLVGHDWGAIFLYRLSERYSNAAGRLVTLEIGAAPAAFTLTLFVLCYHALIIMAYLLGSGLGDRLMRALCRVMRRPPYPNAAPPRAQHGWLYRQAWREGSSHGPWPLYYRNAIATWRPQEGLPLLFIYGEDGPKRLRFHTPAWRKAISEHTPSSRSVGIPGGHWCFVEQPEIFVNTLNAFVRDTPARTP